MELRQKLLKRPQSSLYLVQRAEGRKKIFFRPEDYKIFKTMLIECMRDYQISIYAYGLEEDRFHLVIKTGEHGAHQALAELRSRFTSHKSFENRKKKPSFRSEFKVMLVQENRTLIQVIQHTHEQNHEHNSWNSYLNPDGSIKADELFRKLSPTREESLKMIQDSKRLSYREIFEAKKWPPVVGEELYCQSVLQSLT